MFGEIYEQYSKRDFKVAKDYSDNEIRNAIDTYQGDSIPGFHSFDSFLALIHPKIFILK